MKKIFLILSMMIPCSLLAGNISPEQAQRVAEQFFAARTTRAAAPSVTLKWDGRKDATRSTAAEAPFYVFDNTTGGFVIVAGEECISPILGYSTSGAFKVDGMPENISYWFDYIRQGVEYARTSHKTTTSAVKAEWQAYINGTTRSLAAATSNEKLLTTALWDQSAPYNIEATKWCNFAEGSVFTGCVATATSIIMRYHKHPYKGNGTLPSYNYIDKKQRSRHINGYELTTVYDWDNMLLEYKGSNYTQEQATAVALLMKDVGVMAGMSYGTGDTGGSGSDNDFAATGLLKYMDYDASMEKIERGLYSNDEWISRIKSSIDNNCPVLFDGVSSAGGHSFVLDGYDSNNRIHINWGWSGSNNGYYTIPNFGDFRSEQHAYVNIRPNFGGTAPDAFIVMIGNMRWTNPPVLKSADKLQITITTGMAANGSTGKFNGKIYLAHTDKNDKIKSYLETITATNLETGIGYRYDDKTYTIDMSNLAEGDKIKWFYQLNGSDQILPAKVNSEKGLTYELLINFDKGIYNLESLTSVEYNASEHKIYVKLKSSDISCTLLQANGSTVTSGVTAGNMTYTIDTKTLPSGTYTLRLTLNGYTKDLKLIL